MTFNYDRVIEMLNPPRMNVVLPSAARDAEKGRILKLHGSVDWRRDNNGSNFTATEDPIFAVTAADNEIALATPGPTKRKVAREFRVLWDNAKSALENAEAIVFIGYRFPPSDAEAREKLLGAIAANTQRTLAIHIVLGLPGPDSERLAHLLKFMCRRAKRHDWDEGPVQAIAGGRNAFRVISHPLYAQDFLSVWSREMLFTQ